MAGSVRGPAEGAEAVSGDIRQTINRLIWNYSDLIQHGVAGGGRIEAAERITAAPNRKSAGCRQEIGRMSAGNRQASRQEIGRMSAGNWQASRQEIGRMSAGNRQASRQEIGRQVGRKSAGNFQAQ